MDKLKLHSPNLTEANIEKVAEIFPSCIVEAKNESGELTRKVDFDQLRQELSDSIVEGSQERYRLDWPGKRKSLVAANAPIIKTLRPCNEESVEFDTTKNLFIEGDNLDALKLLQETYLGKVKMIYIDPPYNTGNDFVYNDNFSDTAENYKLRSNQEQEEQGRLVTNTETNGRFHSDWLSMIYPRLKLARNLLKEDGVIFFNIGEEEAANAENLLNEIFGAENKISTVSRVAKTASNLGTHFASSVDFLLVYAKNIQNLPAFKGPVDDSLYKKTETDGPRKGERFRDDVAFFQSSQKDLRPNQKYFINCPDGSKVIPPCSVLDETMRKGDGRWRWSKETFLKKSELIVFKKTKTSPLLNQHGEKAEYNLYTKSYLKDREEAGTLPRNIITEYINRKGADLLKKMGIKFDFSKPVGLIQYLADIQKMSGENIILDFFAGSSTTAHAVMQLNAEDNGERRFIMIQLPEPCNEKSDAHKEGYKTIADISKERIRRAGIKIKEENATTAADLDIGFRVLKIDTSNAKDIYYTPDAINQEELALQVDHIKEGRTAEDLLFQVMLDWGVDLALPISKESIQEKDVYFVDENAIAACFDTKINEAFVKELAKREPLRVVFRDTCFESDSAKINVAEIFKLLSPNTDIKTI